MNDFFQFDYEEDIYIVKMTSGATLVCKLEFMDEDGEYYKLIYPYELIKTTSGAEVMIGFYPWLFGAKDNETIVHSNDIICLAEASNNMVSTFKDLMKSSNFNKGNKSGLDNLDFPQNPWKNRMN